LLKIKNIISVFAIKHFGSGRFFRVGRVRGNIIYFFRPKYKLSIADMTHLIISGHPPKDISIVPKRAKNIFRNNAFIYSRWEL